jgi:tRNA (Thr-GGU) A37 N-methylase
MRLSRHVAALEAVDGTPIRDLKVAIGYAVDCLGYIT